MSQNSLLPLHAYMWSVCNGKVDFGTFLFCRDTDDEIMLEYEKTMIFPRIIDILWSKLYNLIQFDRNIQTVIEKVGSEWENHYL